MTAQASLRAPFQHLARSTWWSVCLLTLLLALAFGGPAACVIHCQRHQPGTHQPIPRPVVEATASHGAHAHHAHGLPLPAEPDSHHAPTTDDHPSALTIGVLLPLALAPALRVSRRWPIFRCSAPRGQIPAPPRDPPRDAVPPFLSISGI